VIIAAGEVVVGSEFGALSVRVPVHRPHRAAVDDQLVGVHQGSDAVTPELRNVFLRVDTLRDRRGLPYLGEQTMMFPSTAGTWRDPDNFGRQWRGVRDELGAAGVTSHSFRKTMATLIDDGGMSARIGADHLGHAQVSMTQNVYMSRGRVHPQVAELLERVVISDE
jgi:integrase